MASKNDAIHAMKLSWHWLFDAMPAALFYDAKCGVKKFTHFHDVINYTTLVFTDLCYYTDQVSPDTHGYANSDTHFRRHFCWNFMYAINWLCALSLSFFTTHMTPKNAHLKSRIRACLVTFDQSNSCLMISIIETTVQHRVIRFARKSKTNSSRGLS